MTADASATVGTEPELVRVDARGRVNVSRFAAAGTPLLMHCTAEGAIVLRPAVVVTAVEYANLGRQFTAASGPVVHVAADVSDAPAATSPA